MAAKKKTSKPVAKKTSPAKKKTATKSSKSETAVAKKKAKTAPKKETKPTAPKKKAVAKKGKTKETSANPSVASAPVIIDPNNPYGKKFTCYSCGSKFYDLNKPEKICPKCGADQMAKSALRSRQAALRASDYDYDEDDNIRKAPDEDEEEENFEEESTPAAVPVTETVEDE